MVEVSFLFPDLLIIMLAVFEQRLGNRQGRGHGRDQQRDPTIMDPARWNRQDQLPVLGGKAMLVPLTTLRCRSTSMA